TVVLDGWKYPGNDAIGGLATKDHLCWSEQPYLSLVLRLEHPSIFLYRLGGSGDLFAGTNRSAGRQLDRGQNIARWERFATEHLSRRHAASDLPMADEWDNHPGRHHPTPLAD